MRVLVVHNRYQEPGGEDRVVQLETALLARYGHTVIQLIDDNARVEDMPRVKLALNTIWSREAYHRVRRLIAEHAIDLVHVHNTLPLLSPSVYYASRASGVPVVQTLHNYRLFCANGRCFRDGHACSDCLGRSMPWPALRHACYRNSHLATGAVASMLMVHRAAGTWQGGVDSYIAPSEFARRLFAASGLPADRVVVKPHFVDPDPGAGSGDGGYALYVGRLSADKGIETLLAAWRRLASRIPLWIAGDGPLAPAVAEAAAAHPGITCLGRQQRSELPRLMADASFVVFPSPAFETFGQVITEAYASGTPVVGARASVADELIDDGTTGVLTRPGDADDLVSRVEWLLAHPARLRAMRVAARTAYERRFTAETNYRQLMEIYDCATRLRAPSQIAAARQAHDPDVPHATHATHEAMR